jgi:hypothetical protein
MGLGDQSHLNETWSEYVNPPKSGPRRVPIPEKHLWTYTYDKDRQELIKLVRPFNMVHGKTRSGKQQVDDYDELSGGAVGENISSTAESVSNVVENVTGNAIMEGLEKAGIFQGTKDAIGSVTRKLDWTLRNPAAAKKFRITSNLIPNLQFQYEKNANLLAVKGDRLKDFRKDNIRLRMMNIEAKIKRELAKVMALDESKIDLDYTSGGTCYRHGATSSPYACFSKGIGIAKKIYQKQNAKSKLNASVPVNNASMDLIKSVAAQQKINNYRKKDVNALRTELKAKNINRIYLEGFGLSKASKHVLCKLCKSSNLPVSTKPEMLKALKGAGVVRFTIKDGAMQLNKMTKKDLQQHAKSVGVKTKGLLKGDIIKLLKEKKLDEVKSYLPVMKV